MIGQQLGRPVEYADLPAEQWHAILTKQVGLPEFLANHRCFFRQLLLRAEYSLPRLLEIPCTVTSDSLRQACSVLRTCLTTQQSPGIQVRSSFPRLLETINNTSLKKHPSRDEPTPI